MSRERLLAGLGLALVLLVVVAAAGIRLETGIPGLRIVHRAAASLAVLVVVWLAWIEPHSRAVWIALGLTALLSVVGIAAGREPPPAAAATNLLGGLALAAVLAWMAGKKKSGRSSGDAVLPPFFGVLIAAQLALGAWLSIVERAGMALPAHGLLAVGLTALLVWFAGARRMLLVFALAAPLAGFTALQYEHSAAAALVHAAAAALLLAAGAYAFRRGA